MENCELDFTEGALKKIAAKATEKGTGARGLRSILEQVMLDIMYDLPDQAKGSKIVVDEETVGRGINCLLYTSPSPRDATLSRMPSSA